MLLCRARRRSQHRSPAPLANRGALEGDRAGDRVVGDERRRIRSGFHAGRDPGEPWTGFPGRAGPESRAAARRAAQTVGLEGTHPRVGAREVSTKRAAPARGRGGSGAGLDRRRGVPVGHASNGVERAQDDLAHSDSAPAAAAIARAAVRDSTAAEPSRAARAPGRSRLRSPDPRARSPSRSLPHGPQPPRHVPRAAASGPRSRWRARARWPDARERTCRSCSRSRWILVQQDESPAIGIARSVGSMPEPPGQAGRRSHEDLAPARRPGEGPPVAGAASAVIGVYRA